MKECTTCAKTVDDRVYDDDYGMCNPCLKIERAQDTMHVDACTKCGIPFDVDKFTWRKDTRLWRQMCTTCTTRRNVRKV